MKSLSWATTVVLGAALFGALAVGYAVAHEAGERHAPDPNSPSDLMMEQCLGPEGHTQVGRMIDQMHGEGAHHRMHQFMDQMMLGGMAGGGRPGRMGPGQPGPGMGPGMMIGPGMMRGMMGRGI